VHFFLWPFDGCVLCNDLTKISILFALQKVLSRILTRLGVQNVRIVGNGQEAVDLERAEPFDIILMDMQMPVLDGVSACRKIVARTDVGDHPIAQVIFVTAHVSKDFEKQCREAGAVDFLSKPCNLKMVDESLTRFVQSRICEY